MDLKVHVTIFHLFLCCTAIYSARIPPDMGLGIIRTNVNANFQAPDNAGSANKKLVESNTVPYVKTTSYPQLKTPVEPHKKNILVSNTGTDIDFRETIQNNQSSTNNGQNEDNSSTESGDNSMHRLHSFQSASSNYSEKFPEDFLIPESESIISNDKEEHDHVIIQNDPTHRGILKAYSAPTNDSFISNSIFKSKDVASSYRTDESSIVIPSEITETNEIKKIIAPHPTDKLENFNSFASAMPTISVANFKNNKNSISETSAESSSIEDQWRDLEKTFRRYTDSVMKKVLPKILRIHSQLNVSTQCNSAMMQLITGLRNFKSWAIRMVDASGRLPSGSLEGTLTDLGDYDQCLDILQPLRNKHKQIRGQYCTLEVKPTLPALQNSVTLNTKVLDFGNLSKDSVLSDLSDGSALFHFMVMRIGVCVPSLCVADDIRELASALLKNVPVQVTARNCETKEESHVTIPQFIIIITIVIIGVLILAGTGIDSYVSRNAAKSQDIAGRVPQSLLAFSVTSNIRQLLKPQKKGSNLLAVNGIRCLSIMWIVLAHTYGFGHRQGLARLKHAKTYMDDVFFQIITNAWVSVDTFFLLGGLLVAISNLKAIDNNGGSINILSHILHRIWRLTPPVAGTLGVMFMLPLVGSGPLWADMVGQKVANCEERWWQVFLPVNTWIDFSSMCLLHTWYVAADMHFYFLAPFALIALYRWPAVGFALMFLLTAVCSMVVGLLTIANDLPPTVIFFSPDVELTKRTANLVYFRPYPHLGAYCVGLTLGYILWKNRKWSLSKLTQGVGWMLSIASCLSVLCATYSWSRGTSAHTAEGVIYAMLHRTAWAAGVAWVLFVCVTGHGGILSRFLSWQLFVPLSRLCYCVYLLHFPVLWVRVSWRRTLLNFHHYDVVTEFFGVLMITLGLSIIFHLFFEAPFLKLEQIWFPDRKKSSENLKTLENKHST
ncbi:O-acyltransferase like protein-like [Uloborus diversus]|uniref:O-acyltransferase like protein-like n=1 Tax=Uloborus diversus TaxID=327109 RepID=UPI00240A5502|nr:O-acyltransferase like protein-like [Uloborus diversus]